MTTFAHTYASAAEAAASFKPNDEARYTLVFHGADGSVATVDSEECPAYDDRVAAIGAAMDAVRADGDSCDILWYGGEYGTAEWLETAEGFFTRRLVVFSAVIL